MTLNWVSPAAEVVNQPQLAKSFIMLRWSNAIKKLNMRCHQLHQVSPFFAKKHQKSENEAEVERFDGQLKLTSVAKKTFSKFNKIFFSSLFCFRSRNLWNWKNFLCSKTLMRMIKELFFSFRSNDSAAAAIDWKPFREAIEAFVSSSALSSSSSAASITSRPRESVTA